MTKWVVLGLVVAACGAAPMLEAGVDDGEGLDAGALACGPLTCSGCCRDNVCLRGDANDACGHTGRQCKACGVGTRCESPGACFALPSDAGVVRRSAASARCVMYLGRLHCG